MARAGMERPMADLCRAPSVSRRSFLGGAGAAAGSVTLPERALCRRDGRTGHCRARRRIDHAARQWEPSNIATARTAGQAAIAAAEPLHGNAYKLPILATLVRPAVLQAAGATNPEIVR